MKTNIIVKRRMGTTGTDGEILPQPKNIDVVIELGGNRETDAISSIAQLLCDPVILNVIKTSGCASVIIDNLPIDHSVDVVWDNLYICEKTIIDLLSVVKDTLFENASLSNHNMREIAYKAPYWIAISKSVTESVTEFMGTHFNDIKYTDVDIEQLTSLIYQAGVTSKFTLE